MDRNAILNGYISSFTEYSSTDSRKTVEKVLKYSGSSSDILKRADIKTEVVVFKLLNGSTDYRLNDEKPSELIQNFEALVYVDQSNLHSMKDIVYDRALEISDQLFDWATNTTASDINNSLWTLSVIGVNSIEERNGFLSSTINFESIIQIS